MRSGIVWIGCNVMNAGLTEVKIAVSALEVLRIRTTSNEKVFALVTLMEGAHCTSFIVQRSVVLAAEHSAILSEYLFTIVCYRELFGGCTAGETTRNQGFSAIGHKPIDLFFHLLDHGFLLRHSLLHIRNTTMEVLCHYRSWNTCKAALIASLCDLSTLGIVGGPHVPGERCAAASYLAGHWERSTFFR